MTQLTTPADLVLSFDERTIREFVIDDGADLHTVDLATNAKLIRLLSVAEEFVRSKLRKSGRYTSDEIEALSGSSLNMFKHIVCQFCMLDLLSRRPTMDDSRWKAQQALSEQYLESLQKGEMLLTETDADIAATRVSQDGPSVTDIYNNNGIVTRSKYFPRMMLPSGRNH